MVPIERLAGSPLAGARSPITFIMKLGSIFASTEGSRGGNSTTRSAVPASGGSAGNDLAALSSLNDNPVGTESDVQRMVDGVPVPPGSRVRRLQKAQLP